MAFAFGKLCIYMYDMSDNMLIPNIDINFNYTDNVCLAFYELRASVSKTIRPNYLP